MSRVAAVLIIILLIAPAIASERVNYAIMKNGNGRTLYVGGSGPGNYSKIQDAIENASNGDTIFVYSGTYYENVVINKSIDLIGENVKTTIIDGMRRNKTVFILVSNVLVCNFTIRNGTVGIGNSRFSCHLE
ncbi:MAG: hypothetical protein DRN11_01820, partial [Thermoplasmata archaeon]